jgi:MFS family permease
MNREPDDERPFGIFGASRYKRAPLVQDAAVLRRDLSYIHTDAIAHSVMMGTGETYIAAFALALGFGDIIAGVVASGPLLAGAILQLVSPYAIRRLGSHRRWVVLNAGLQASSFVPLVVAAITGHLSTLGLLAIVTFYWATGMATGPAWNTWVGTLVPRSVRARFFARRSRVGQAALLAALLTGGAILHWSASHGEKLLGFAALFLIAGLARAVSSWLLAHQSEPDPLVRRVTGDLDLAPPRSTPGNRRLLAYLLAVQTGVHIAAPFFTPYMLGESALGLSYAGYMSLIAASFISKIFALPWLGHFAAKYGARRLLRLAGLAVVPLPALWTFSNDYTFLLGIQLLSGIAWGAHELATFLLFFDAIRPEERTRLLTWFNLASATAMVVGTAAGGWLLSQYGANMPGYATLFWISAGARALTLPLLAWMPDVRIDAAPPAMRILAARPSAGSIDRPVLSDREDSVVDGPLAPEGVSAEP